MKATETYIATGLDRNEAAFCLYWRFRATHPWNIEEFQERPRAYNRFFNLLERGIEARFHTRGSGERF